MKSQPKEQTDGRGVSWLSRDKFVYYLLLLIPALAWLFGACTGGGGGGGNHP
jgi:hypothetical protein